MKFQAAWLGLCIAIVALPPRPHVHDSVAAVLVFYLVLHVIVWPAVLLRALGQRTWQVLNCYCTAGLAIGCSWDLDTTVRVALIGAPVWTILIAYLGGRHDSEASS